MRACTTDALTCASVCARAGACAYGRPRIRAANVRALSVGVERVRLGSQAFYSATAFNTNIGAWNTAAVTTLYAACTDFGQRRTTRRTRSVGARCAAAVHAHLYV